MLVGDYFKSQPRYEIGSKFKWSGCVYMLCNVGDKHLSLIRLDHGSRLYAIAKTEDARFATLDELKKMFRFAPTLEDGTPLPEFVKRNETLAVGSRFKSPCGNEWLLTSLECKIRLVRLDDGRYDVRSIYPVKGVCNVIAEDLYAIGVGDSWEITKEVH